MTETIEGPAGVHAEIAGRTVKVKGPKGEVTKDFKAKKVELVQEGSNVTLKAKDATRREKMRLFAIRA
ncbi:50S ribosomal protein L6, partial [Candidatus Woesearchaeota archaeon]|nr:50S ribosomal protein L6 [Candidatus Woesearchaeota archaeon]